MMWVLLLDEPKSVPEKIAKRKTIVYKSRIDPTVIKLTAEKMKSKLFTKAGFLKPGPEEIRVVSIDKYYQPYVVVDGKYQVDYYKKRVFTFEVDAEAREVLILDEAFKPETVADVEGTRKVVRIEGEERLSYEDKAYVILDASGREVSPDLVPSAPCEERPLKVLKEFRKKTGKVKTTPEKEIELVRSRIVKRPVDLGKVGKELFDISEHAVIYSPIYEIAFRNVRTREEKTIRIDGVTARIIP